MWTTLFAPLDASTFHQQHWEQRALALPPRPARFLDIGFDLDELLRQLAMLRPERVGQLVKAQTFDRQGRHVEIAIDGHAARDCFAAGMTVCIGSIERFLPSVARFADSLRRELGFCGEVSLACYWSPDQAGFGLHFDERAVAICQLAGRKRWWHGDAPAIARPRCNLVVGHAESERQFLALHPGAPLPSTTLDQLAETELAPGALLYLPAGTWHRTAAQGESLALTIRFLPVSRATLVTSAVERALSRRRELRESVPLDADAEPAALDSALAMLREAVDELTPDDLRLQARLAVGESIAPVISIADGEPVAERPAPASASRRPLALGLLDACSGPDAVLWHSIELAQRADALGYSRFWLAEHHSIDAAHGAPELLVPIIAGLTQRIRVGTGGIPLPLYSPLKVAKSFLLLQALFPDRVDLGVVRTSLTKEQLQLAAPPAFDPRDDGAILHALLDGRVIDETPDELFERKLDRLLQFLSQGQVRPFEHGAPEPWVLGSSRSGARAAAAGAGFGLSLFMPWLEEPSAIESYRRAFRPGLMAQPRALLAVAGTCADDEARAQAIAREHTNRFFTPRVVGSPEQCAEQLEELRDRYAVDELLFFDIARRYEDRLRSIELLAAACGLPRASEPLAQAAAS